jgi:hypothetical protein
VRKNEKENSLAFMLDESYPFFHELDRLEVSRTLIK